MNYLNNVSDKNLKRERGGDYIHDLEKKNPQKTETEKTQEHMILAKFNTYCENQTN